MNTITKRAEAISEIQKKVKKMKQRNRVTVSQLITDVCKRHDVNEKNVRIIMFGNELMNWQAFYK